MMMIGSIEEKKIVIAGGTSGIGLETAKLFNTLGAEVIVFGRNAQKLSQVLADNHFSARSQLVDGMSRIELDHFFKKVDGFDHLVICLSGGKGAGKFLDLDLQDLRAGFEGKFWPQLNSLQAALPYLSAQGSITLLTAVSATSKRPGYAGLAAINGALEAMVPVLAKELAPIRVNAVSPGVIATEWWDQFERAKKLKLMDDFIRDIPANRLGHVQDVAKAIYAVSQMEYYTGRVLPVDGGLGL